MKESSGAEKDGAAKKTVAKTAVKKPAKTAVKAKKPGRPAGTKNAKAAAGKPAAAKKTAGTAKAPASKPKTPKASRTKTAGTKKAGTAKTAVKAKKPGRPAGTKNAKTTARKPAAAKKPAKTAAEKPARAAKKTAKAATEKPARAAKKPGKPGRPLKASAPVQAEAGRPLALSYCSCPSTELKFSRITAALSRENILYVLEDTRTLSSWNISSPREIKKLGEISLERTPFKMKLFGNTLYVLRKPHWLNFKRSYYIDVIDVSNPASLIIKNQIKLDFTVSSLCADKDENLLVTGEEGIYWIKAGSPSLAYAFGEELRLGSGHVDIAVQGSCCFAAGDHEVGLYIFTMLSGGKLSLLKHLPTPGYLFTEAPIHFYKGGRFVLFVRDETLVMADVKEPDKAKVLETVKIPGLKLCGQIVSSGNEAWLFGLSRTAPDENILAVVDLKETGPALKTKINLAGYGHGAANDDVKALFRQDNYLFVFTFNRGLGLFEIR
ncbi:MAG: hypothetical protein LBQ14_12540 [Treponema sp.]|jgi:hypothetical protein|nr:hypothetical protein [Treponema sp.]